MSFIQRLSKEQIPSKKKPAKKVPINLNFEISYEEKEDKIALSLVGDKLREDEEYEWNLELDSKPVKSVTIGPVLVLTKSNTNLFNKAKVVTAKVIGKRFVTKKIIVKDNVTSNQEPVAADN